MNTRRRQHHTHFFQFFLKGLFSPKDLSPTPKKIPISHDIGIFFVQSLYRHDAILAVS